MYGSEVDDPREMNNSGIIKNDGGFPGIRNRCLLCPIAFLLGLLVFGFLFVCFKLSKL